MCSISCWCFLYQSAQSLNYSWTQFIVLPFVCIYSVIQLLLCSTVALWSIYSICSGQTKAFALLSPLLWISWRFNGNNICPLMSSFHLAANLYAFHAPRRQGNITEISHTLKNNPLVGKLNTFIVTTLIGKVNSTLYWTSWELTTGSGLVVGPHDVQNPI